MFGIVLAAWQLMAQDDTTLHVGSSPQEADEIVRMARQYLETDCEKDKAELAQGLAKYDRQWNEVVAALRPRPTVAATPGYYKEEHFTVPNLRERHPDDLLYFVVPSSYQVERPTGLVVFMHGGGKGSPRTAPASYMTPADPTTPPTSPRLGDLFEAAGMIGVGPSAPWNENDHSRWCIPEADDYLADVIWECKHRFNIDADRVFLAGHSMGGFGAYHQVQRQPDRFAAVIASAGSWSLAQWPVIHGTSLFIVHGTKDAEPGVRDRHTDIAFAHRAHQLLNKHGIPHVFTEHPGGHPVGYGKSHILEFLRTNEDLRRDPFHSHVVLASPVGYGSSKCYAVRHNRWVTLDEATEGQLEYDALVRSGPGHSKDSSVEEWEQWKLDHKTVKREGALIDAINSGDNQFQVTTKNVGRLMFWLHPAMVDFSKPVQVTVNGELRFDKCVAPSLPTLLDSFARRRDWGLVYPAKITLDLRHEENEANGEAGIPIAIRIADDCSTMLCPKIVSREALAAGETSRNVVAARPAASAVPLTKTIFRNRGTEHRLEAIKKLCRMYMDGFCHSNTNLMYGQRLNGPNGIAVFESPEQIAKEQVKGKYMPYGYGSGIQDPGLLNGMFLFALCDAFDATEDPYLADLARRIFKGLKLVGTISPVSGFVPRGPHPDGKSYYRDSSLDQHSLFVCGLWRYYHSPIANDEEKTFIRDALHKFAKRMEKNGWTLMVEDDSRIAHVGWCWLSMTPLNAEIMLSMVGAVQDVTGDEHWKQEYERFSNEADAKRWVLLDQEETRLPCYTLYSSQNDYRLITLARLERDPKRKAIAQRRVQRRAQDMLTCDFFTHWRRLDWIGKRPEPVVNEFLKPLGLSVDRKATVFDLWDAFDPEWRSPKLSDGTRPWGQGMGLQIPMMAWQVALLGEDPKSVCEAHLQVPNVYEKINFSRTHSGWTFNYAVVLALLDLASKQEI